MPYELIHDTNELKSRFDHEVPVIGFSCVWARPSHSNAAGYRILAENLVRKGYQVIFFIGVDEIESTIPGLEAFEHVYAIPESLFHEVDFIQILFVQNGRIKSVINQVPYPSNAYIVSHAHAFGLNPDESPLNYSYCVVNADFYLVYQRRTLKKLRKSTDIFRRIIKRKNLTRNHPNFYFLPCSYPNLDNYLSKARQSSFERDSILIVLRGLYAPNAKKFLEQDVPKIISLVRKKFTQYRIIIRPFPGEHDEVKKVLKHFIDGNDISIDTEKIAAKTYSRGRVLITTDSACAESFSFSTKCPRIRCEISAITSIFYKYQEDGYGFKIYSMSYMEEVLNNSLIKTEEWEFKIRNYFGNEIIEAGRFSQVMEEYIERIISNKPSENWIKIDREVSSYRKNYSLYNRIQDMTMLITHQVELIIQKILLRVGVPRAIIPKLFLGPAANLNALMR
jgi:hypothetical protein